MAKEKLKEKSGWWMVLKVALIVIAFVLVVGLGYVAYCYIVYYRLPDHLSLEVHEKSETAEPDDSILLKTDETYTIVTYNIGFGAYTPEFSFFMDGGTESWAFSEDSCKAAITGVMHSLEEADADIMILQEVDVDSTRSYHIDQSEMITYGFSDYNWVFAQNYDSPFLIYPFHQPHGKSKAGLLTLSRFDIASSIRRSFPVTSSISKFLDLDRCFSVTTIPVDNGKNLRVFNLHMSAYGSDDSVREGQIKMLIEEMEAAYEAGDYVICGGDFNHDLSLPEDVESIASWAYPFPRSELPAFLHFAHDTMSEKEKEALGKSSRDDDTGYVPGVTGEYLLDGYIISDNVNMTGYRIVDDDYAYSDHEPVIMEFVLIE